MLKPDAHIPAGAPAPGIEEGPVERLLITHPGDVAGPALGSPAEGRADTRSAPAGRR